MVAPVSSWPMAVWLLLMVTGLRHVALGAVAVVLGLYLSLLGFDPVTAGLIFTAMLGGGAASAVLFGVLADRVGRRQLLLLATLALLVTSLVFAFSSLPPLLLAVAILGVLGPTGFDTGPTVALEQAALVEATQVEQRTSVLAAHTLVSMLGSGVGALWASAPGLVGLSGMIAYRTVFLSAAVTGVVLCVLVSQLPATIEAVRRPATGRSLLGLRRSRRLVLSLSALFSVDAFAGGLAVQSAVAYWFVTRFGAPIQTLAVVFSLAQFLMAGSLLLASPLTRRFGPVNTMVFTHLPANLLLALVPLVPSFELAATLFVARHLTATLDVPPRQALLLSLVEPDERGAAAGLTAAARTAGSAVAPAAAGLLWNHPLSGLPLVIAGALKSAYDLALFALLRGARLAGEHESPVLPGRLGALPPGDRRP
jgi:MFS family permease